MSIFSGISRKMIAARFKRKNLLIIEALRPVMINEILHNFVSEGWEVASQFDNATSLNSQGKCIIRRGQSTLIFTLHPNTSGNIVGPARIISDLAKQYGQEAFSTPQG